MSELGTLDDAESQAELKRTQDESNRLLQEHLVMQMAPFENKLKEC
jgi:hypothetical protein